MDEKKEFHKYDDIINLPHPVSKTHPRMSLHDRAAQFSAFAALTGHEEAVMETARLTEERQILTEDAIAKLNEQLQLIRENLDKKWEVVITYFIPDAKKSGGAYISHSGIVKKMDVYTHTIVMEDGTVIPMEEILEMEVRSDSK